MSNDPRLPPLPPLPPNAPHYWNYPPALWDHPPIVGSTSSNSKEAAPCNSESTYESVDTFSAENLVSPIVLLRVGPNEVVLTAHKAILTSTVYFANCLKKSRFEGRTNIIKLPEDEPTNVAAVIRFLYSGSIFSSGDRHSESYLTNLVKAYAIADKYCIVNMCVEVIKLVEEKPEPLLVWDHMEQLKAMGLRGSSLWKYFTVRIQRRLRGELEAGIDLGRLWQDGLGADDETSTELLGQLIGRLAT